MSGTTQIQNSAGATVDPATQTTSAAILAALGTQATAAKQDTGNTALAAIQAALQIMDNWQRGDQAAVIPDLEPVAASGQKDDTIDSSTTSFSVVAGALYRITAHNGLVHVGTVDSTATANRLLTIPAGCWEYLRAPTGITTIYVWSASSGVSVSLSRIKNS